MDRLLQAACDYINENAAELHGTEKLDLGGDITSDNVMTSEVSDSHIVLVVDRGIKGAPKYTIPLAALEKARVAPKPAAKPRAKKAAAKKKK